MDFVIEKGIPMSRTNNKFPLKQMEIGDSFVVPLERTIALRMAIQRLKLSNSKLKFATRTDGNGVRAFRVA